MNETTAAAPQSNFRILALDGGGVRGIFTASCLNALEDLSHTKIAIHFDLLTGTSSGGIIALALAFGIPPRRILELFRDKGDQIFGNPRNFVMLLRPKYENVALSNELRAIFEDRKLNDVSTPVCIPSYELTSSYPRIWKDDHARDLNFGGDQLAWKIALATSAAPLFFPAAEVVSGDCHVDGGMFANNPTLIGLTEAIRYFRQSLNDIRVLSIGTGEHTEPVPYNRARRMGVWQWKTLAYEHMLVAQARTTQEIAKSLLPAGNLCRLNIPLDRSYKLDDFRAAQGLIEPGAHQARLNFPDLRERFFYSPATAGREQAALERARRIMDAGPNGVSPR